MNFFAKDLCGFWERFIPRPRVISGCCSLRESEERFSGAFEHAPIGMALVSPDGRWIKVNREICKLVGYAEAELLARTFQDITHPEDLDADLECVRQMLAGEIHTYQIEKRYIHAQGHHVAVLLSVSLVRDGSGAPLYFISQIQDISERNRSEAALRESDRRYHSLFENMLEGYVYCRAHFEQDRVRDFTYLEVNGAFERLTGLKDVVGRNVSDVIPGIRETNPELFDVYSRVALTGTPEKLETYVESLDRWFSTTVYSSERGHFVAVFDNITDRKRAEAELERTHRELVEASRKAGMAEFATGVLHNVGNVLNSVVVASTCVAASLRKSKSAGLSRVVSLLREHEANLGAFIGNDPRGRQLTNFLASLADNLASQQAAALDELGHLQKSIEHIKAIVAVQQGQAKDAGKAEMEQIAVLVEDTLRMSAHSLGPNEIRVVRDYADIPSAMVDRHKVLQILVNLVHNAKQACDAVERPDRTLTVRVFNGSGTVKVAVSDNGIGIPRENLSRIFNHGFSTKKDGHGFGLNSCAVAAREMGGALIVESPGPGLGATFTLELPVQSAA